MWFQTRKKSRFNLERLVHFKPVIEWTTVPFRTVFFPDMSTVHNSSLMRKQSGFKKLVKWKWYEIRNFINKFGWNSIFKKIFSITSGLNGLLILIGDKVRYKKGSKKLKPKGMVLVKGRNQGFSNPYFLKIWSTKT